MNKKYVLVLRPFYGYDRMVVPFGKLCYDLKMFERAPYLFGLVMFTGGDDVSPALYGHKQCYLTQNNWNRDNLETAVFQSAIRNKIPMVGICRGFQFLNVMSGGFMIQHIHHDAYHKVRNFDGTVFKVNSLHHQMVHPRLSTYVMAASHGISSEYYLVDDGRKPNGSIRYLKTEKPNFPVVEVEAAYFPYINAFGVQWHPEMMGYNDPTNSYGIQYFYNFTELLMGGLIETVLKENHCPTMHDLFKHRKGLSGEIYEEVRRILYERAETRNVNIAATKK